METSELALWTGLLVWFFLMTSAQLWLIGRTVTMKRDLQSRIERLKTAMDLIDGVDVRILKIAQRSIDNEMEIEAVGRSHKRLNNAVNSRKHRDEREDEKLAIISSVDELTALENQANNEPPPAASPPIDPAYL